MNNDEWFQVFYYFFYAIVLYTIRCEDKDIIAHYIVYVGEGFPGGDIMIV